MKSLLILFLIFGAFIGTMAQTVDTAWVRTYNGPADAFDYVNGMYVDDSGNVYVTGQSDGIGTYDDFVTIKYDRDGNQVWLDRYNGPDDTTDIPGGIFADPYGYAYVTGVSWMTGTTSEIVTIKYKPNGDTVWVRRYQDAAGAHNGSDIAVDGGGYIYVSGTCTGAVGFTNYVMIKYQPDGDTSWVRDYDGTGSNSDFGGSLALDSSDNVYMTGNSVGAGNWDYATIKYDSAGNQQWVKRYDGTGSGYDWMKAMAVDSLGNVYVTGESAQTGSGQDCLTIKYDTDGDTVWVRSYKGFGTENDAGISIVANEDGNAYVAAHIRNATNLDYVTIKYESNGDSAWVQTYDTGGDDYNYDITLDDSGNVYVTGASPIIASNDVATIKYKPDGTQQWLKAYNGTDNLSDDGKYIHVDDTGRVYIAGPTNINPDADDMLVIKYLPLPTKHRVTSTLDAGDGSLRQALHRSNINPNCDTVVFDVSGTIYPLSILPTFTEDSTLVWGSTAPGGVHSVILDGSSAPTGPGLGITSGMFNLIEGLTIRNFDGTGIRINGAGRFNTFSNNLIYNNAYLGINLGADQVTPNDSGDIDVGPNNLFNYPEIDSVYMQPDSSFIVYGHCADSATLEFFVAHPVGEDDKLADTSGHGEAYTYVGSLVEDTFGDSTFQFTFDNSHEFFTIITATATDPQGNTSEFCENFGLIPSPLTVVAYSPINIIVVNPNLLEFGKESNGDPIEEYPGEYFEVPHDSVVIPNPIPGKYEVRIVAEDGAPSGATYSAIIKVDGTQQATLAVDQDVPSDGALSTFEYDVEEGYHYLNGDANRDETLNVGDAVFLINYVFKNGPAPEPLEAGEANCDLAINVGDAVYMINYVFKSGPVPCYFEP
ncbi:MAG: hypothetical protein GY841_07955 [FCB group bacterium]|nr:hypothetical protein [FCB group bacterium]